MLDQLKSAYDGRNVLITGHTGFKGGWLALWLHRLGARVTGLSHPASADPSFHSAVRLSELIDEVEGDVRSAEDVGRAWKRAEPDFVFHLAAQPLVRLAYEQPAETFETNVMGTVHVLEHARLHAPKTGTPTAVVVVTSDKCYENREWTYGYREVDPLGGKDPYSASKACAELVVGAYRQSFFDQEDTGVRVATGRAGNVIGGGDWQRDRIVPDCVRALTQSHVIDVRSPEAVRPWQHVLDPLLGYLLIGAGLRTRSADKATTGAWNLGPEPGDARSVRDLVDTVLKHWGAGEVTYADTGSAKGEAKLLGLSIEKTRMGLKWMPTWHFERVVQETMNWYRAFYDGGEMREATLHQIESFERDVRKAS